MIGEWTEEVVAGKLTRGEITIHPDSIYKPSLAPEQARDGIEVKTDVPIPKQKKNGTGARATLERDFATAFDDLATICGWTWCGFRPARQKIAGVEQYRTPIIGQKGLPDRILARNGVVLLIEFKAENGKLSPKQKLWGEALKGFRGYYVVRPSDWDIVVKVLTEG